MLARTAKRNILFGGNQEKETNSKTAIRPSCPIELDCVILA